MITQLELQKLIAKNRKELDELCMILTKEPSLSDQPYPPAGDPTFKYSHNLTRLVAEKMLLRKINGHTV
jgi:hypothetical protein